MPAVQWVCIAFDSAGVLNLRDSCKSQATVSGCRMSPGRENALKGRTKLDSHLAGFVELYLMHPFRPSTAGDDDSLFYSLNFGV